MPDERKTGQHQHSQSESEYALEQRSVGQLAMLVLQQPVNAHALQDAWTNLGVHDLLSSGLAIPRDRHDRVTKSARQSFITLLLCYSHC
jgi:hypothetical protein